MLDKYPVRSSSTAYRIINGVAMIAGAPEGRLCTLNKVGTLIWNLGDGKHNMGEIINRICQDFDVDYTRAVRDAEVFIHELEKRKMLALADNPVFEENR